LPEEKTEGREGSNLTVDTPGDEIVNP